MTSSRWLILITGLLVVLGVPFAGKWARSHHGEHCAQDGMKINPLYRVRVVSFQGRDRAFCCIHCATQWLSHQETRPRATFVTDEASGQEIEAATAYFVRSLVVTVPHTGNRIHAFGKLGDADRHASAGRGMVLEDSEKPLKTDNR